MNGRERGKNKVQIQVENRSTLLKLLKANKHICRKDLAELSGLTGAAVTNIIRDLIDAGLVEEDHAYTGLNRKNAVPLRICFERFLVIGVTIQRGLVSSAIADLSGKIVAQSKMAFDLDEPPSAVLERLSQSIQRYIDEYGNRFRIVGIGVSVPGPTNLVLGRISYLTNAPGWTNVPIKDYLAERFSYPVVMNEDANSAVLAEHWLGKGQGRDNLISILASKGVGAGVIVNGQILYGAYGLVGEIGHTSIDWDGPQCECGNRGCLELYCSSLALVRKARKTLGNTDDLGLEAVVEQASSGNRELQDLIIESGKYLGCGIVNLVYTFNPELVTIHGEMLFCGGLWLESIRSAVRERLNPSIAQQVQIEFSSLQDPVLLGTVAMMGEKLFAEPELEYFAH